MVKVILLDYRWCIGYFGKSNADSILRQVKKLSYTEDNLPKIGESIDMGGFYLEVMEYDSERKVLKVMYEKDKR